LFLFCIQEAGGVADALNVLQASRERLRGSKAELSWLLRTTYISNDLQDSKQHAGGNRQAKSDREAKHGSAEKGTREYQLAAIEVSRQPWKFASRA
jgi:hypothetical protein